MENTLGTFELYKCTIHLQRISSEICFSCVSSQIKFCSWNNWELFLRFILKKKFLKMLANKSKSLTLLLLIFLFLSRSWYCYSLYLTALFLVHLGSMQPKYIIRVEASCYLEYISIVKLPPLLKALPANLK